MTEKWRPVLFGRYEVSNLGNVRSVTHYSHDGRRWRGRSIKLTFNDRKNLIFNASLNGRKVTPNVHKLVTLAFLGPCPTNMEINHKDGNRKNNRISNLEYVTHAGNQSHASHAGLMPTKANGRWRRKWRP